MKKILSLIGGRPQFVKEAVVQRALKKIDVEEVLVNSGQHYDFEMSDVFLQNLDITPPKYNLEVGSASHAVMTASIMTAFEQVCKKEKPDLVLLFGDTNTTLAGALVAAKLRIPIAHIEAGIRMTPKHMPEEINREVTDRISDMLFCASNLSVSNLAKENITENVFETGDVMYDLFLDMKDKFDENIFNKLNISKEKIVPVTMHRDYNVDDKEKLVKYLEQLEIVAKDYQVVFPLHPRTAKRIEEFNLRGLIENVIITKPVNYLELMALVSAAEFVITDSGGVQKESCFAGKQSLVCMPDPAWHELVDEGINILVDENTLAQSVSKLSSSEVKANIYGDGNAGEKIAKHIEEFLA